MKNVLEIKRLTRNDRQPPMPFYATSGAAGIDLAAFLEESIVLEPGKSAIIPTGLCLSIPENCVGLIYIRSSLGVKHSITLSNSVGVIDSDYRGEILVSISNNSDVPFTVNDRDRIAQLVITPYVRAEIAEAEQLDETERNAGRFGSTGKQ